MKRLLFAIIGIPLGYIVGLGCTLNTNAWTQGDYRKSFMGDTVPPLTIAFAGAALGFLLLLLWPRKTKKNPPAMQS